jgi:hypothetical protein
LLDDYTSDVSDDEVLLIEQKTIDDLITAINHKFNAGPNHSFSGNIQDLYNYVLNEYMSYFDNMTLKCDYFYIDGIELYNSKGVYESTIHTYDGPLYNRMEFMCYASGGYKINIKYMGNLEGNIISNNSFIVAASYILTEDGDWKVLPEGEGVLDL